MTNNVLKSISAQAALGNCEVFCLFEEYQDAELNYTLRALAVSEDKAALRQLLRVTIAADEYGCIYQNGARVFEPDYFCSHENVISGSYISYQILRCPFYSSEAIMAQIELKKEGATLSVEDVVWFYPESLAVRRFLTECREGFPAIDSVISFILEVGVDLGFSDEAVCRIQDEKACQEFILNALISFLDEEQNASYLDDVKYCYSKERQLALSQVLVDAYSEYLKEI